MADSTALPGCIWVCGACGKVSQTRYGVGADRGWDVSCMMNAIHCSKEKVRGLWQAVEHPDEAATIDEPTDAALPRQPARG
jgi:hypothetical protein